MTDLQCPLQRPTEAGSEEYAEEACPELLCISLLSSTGDGYVKAAELQDTTAEMTGDRLDKWQLKEEMQAEKSIGCHFTPSQGHC